MEHCFGALVMAAFLFLEKTFKSLVAKVLLNFDIRYLEGPLCHQKSRHAPIHQILPRHRCRFCRLVAKDLLSAYLHAAWA